MDESDEAVAAVNDLAEKNDDPDMQVMRRSRREIERRDRNASLADAGKRSRSIARRIVQLFQRRSDENRSVKRFLSCRMKNVQRTNFSDYILVYEDRRATAVDQLMVSIQPATNNDESERMALALQKQKDRHRLYKRRFLSNLSRIGLVMETVNDRRKFARQRFSVRLGCERK